MGSQGALWAVLHPLAMRATPVLPPAQALGFPTGFPRVAFALMQPDHLLSINLLCPQPAWTSHNPVSTSRPAGGCCSEKQPRAAGPWLLCKWLRVPQAPGPAAAPGFGLGAIAAAEGLFVLE